LLRRVYRFDGFKRIFVKNNETIPLLGGARGGYINRVCELMSPDSYRDEFMSLKILSTLVKLLKTSDLLWLTK
jgi:hypothetical protein